MIHAFAIAESIVAPTLFRPEFSPRLDPKQTLVVRKRSGFRTLPFAHEQEVTTVMARVADVGIFGCLAVHYNQIKALGAELFSDGRGKIAVGNDTMDGF